MGKKWVDIESKFKIESLRKSYNLGSHNCCTVAYRAAATLFDNNVSKLREKVDPTTFNIYGSGVVWNNYILSSSWSSVELSSKVHDYFKKEKTEAKVENVENKEL